MQNADAQIKSANTAVASGELSLDGVVQSRDVGQATTLDVLNAQQELLNSQVQLEITKRNVLVAAYTVISAIGRLSVAEVGASGVVYDPEVHYEEVRRKWWGIDITHDDGRREHIDAWQGDVKRESIK
jgi:outer membrane protein